VSRAARCEWLLCRDKYGIMNCWIVPIADGHAFSAKRMYVAQKFPLMLTEDTNLARLRYYGYSDRPICGVVNFGDTFTQYWEVIL
jgi:hypothetical protein